MPINMTKLNMIAQEWDPTPFLEAIEQASAMPLGDPQQGGAMDMGAGADFASVMGGAPQPQGKMPGTGINPAALQMMQPKQAASPQAPAVAPNAPRQVNIRPPEMPQIGRIPSLKDILGGA